MQVNCTNPTIILNPLLSELVSMYGNIVIRGIEQKFINSKKLLYEFKKSQFQPNRLNITVDDFDSCYVRNNYTGETFPVYIQVPCGHCEICKTSKMNAFVDRCKLETQCYNSNPLFITLTYDEFNKKESGVCLRDTQLFLKRLRISLYRKGYREKIRYALVSEYGRRTARPHYHMLLWNCHATDFLSYFEIRETIEKCWSLGFCYIRLVDPRNDKAFYYTSKYLCKDNHVPAGQNKTFMVCSNRGGSIGAQFLDALRENAVKHLNTRLKYVNKWNGKTCDVQVNRYMLNRLVPSLSRSLPYSLKCRVRRFIKDYSILRHRDDVNAKLFAPQLERFYVYFSRYFYIYRYSPNEHIDNDSERSNSVILREMLQDEIFIDNALNIDTNFYEDAVYYADMRQPYLTKVFLSFQEKDLISKSYDYKRNRQLSSNYEIL